MRTAAWIAEYTFSEVYLNIWKSGKIDLSSTRFHRQFIVKSWSIQRTS